jgi:hypothetical protein
MDKYNLLDLKAMLLSFGGNNVVLPNMEEDLKDIIERGQLWGKNTYLIKGEMCQCHKNSILYWGQHKKNSFFVTGYALSSKGTWHQHSWVLTKKNEIIETTVDRVKYFGFILSPLESEIFLSVYSKDNLIKI